MRVPQRMPKRIREDECRFKLRTELCEWGKWWKRNLDQIGKKGLGEAEIIG